MYTFSRFAVATLLIGLFFPQQNVAGQSIVGTWVVDFKKTASEIGDPEKAAGFLEAASGGLKIQMVYRADGSMLVTRSLGSEGQQRKGTYKITGQRDRATTIQVTSPLAGLQWQELYRAPKDYLDQEIVMIGTFREHYPESESFGLAQGEYVIEIFYEELPDQQKASIRKLKNGSEAPLAVTGMLGQSTVEDDEVYFIEASGLQPGNKVFRTDQLQITFLDNDYCKMGTPGDDLLLVWRRVK